MDADASSHYKLVTENMSLLESTEGMKSSQGPLYADARSQREQRTQNNVKILIIMCTLFAIFVAAEVLGSIASNSLSLLGDAAAMSVDVFTYFCNLFAEWMKSDDSRLTWRNRLLLEVLIPGFSLVMLLSVTIYVTNEAIDVLIHDSTDHDSVNVFYLYGFATGNLVVDIISSYYFCAKGGSDVFVTYHHPPAFTLEENVSTSDDQALILRKGYARQPESVKADDISTNNYVDLDGAQQPQPKPNLNMVSAFTHLGGDTIRTLSVFVAAVVSTAAGIPSQTCDAWAAIVVSGTIVLIAFPLVKEIMTAYARLAQERNSS